MGTASLRHGNASRVAAGFGLATALVLAAAGCTAREAPGSPIAQDFAMTTVVMPIEGMSCSACMAQVKKALTSIDGVSDVHVNLIERNARIRFASNKTSSDRLVAAVNALGYRAGPATEDAASPAATKARSEAR